ncbi:MAG: RES domain-containing protein [Acetobacteraceae bacterium]|nr:RES domain-containing protein [Acetobacteraceae bacterium]
MDLWRLCRRPFADLTGEGARLFGGRWNTPGRPMVYLAEHPALAAMEVRVHLDLPFELLPADFVLMGVAIPDRLIRDLEPVPADTAAAGDLWLSEATSAALRVPSILMPHARNVLLNPRHRDAGRAVMGTVETFVFDPRMWRPLGREG